MTPRSPNIASLQKLVAIVLHLIRRGTEQMLAGRVQMTVPTVRVKEAILKQRKFAPVVGYFLIPMALVSYVLALWRLGADLNWLDEFFIHQGILSRWQVWLAIAIATHLIANQLNRIGSEDDGMPS